VNDILGAVFGVVGVQAALRERDHTGRGQRVGSALFETAAFLMAPHMAGIAATGRELPPMPARAGAWAIYQVFDTNNGGQLFIGVTSDQQWSRFVTEFGLTALGSDPRLETNNMRISEKAWLIPAIQEAIAALDLGDAMQRCERANVSWAPVGKPADLFADPHLIAANGLMPTLVQRLDSNADPVLAGIPGLPLEFGAQRKRPVIETQPPGLGADSRRILAQAGYSDAEIVALVQCSVIVGP
jgi:crotonobetainyl-CoA:carnitine CoA-transferase CaiB-like acyl-CoA transferase